MTDGFRPHDRRVTAFLPALGLPVFGVDLSAGTVEFARREHPGPRFEQGSMLAPGLPGGA
ncbi:hypothetical protein [Streptomyces sp. NPDC096152]|uniref:hypothetical protein n=1 Tax=Streptomyces sp. NPDC096152 TaxID=3366078 RepID=UPI003822015F